MPPGFYVISLLGAVVLQLSPRLIYLIYGKYYTPRHLGRKIMQIRELLGIRQEALGEKMGMTQQAVSRLEQKEKVDDETLGKVAEAMGIPTDAIKNLDDNATVYNVVQNNSNNESVNGLNYYCTFNPLEKWVQAIEKNEKLYEELLKSEREKVAMLEKLLDKK